MGNSAVKHQNRAELMGTEKMSTLIPRLAFPPIISFLITSIYNLADTFFVSFLGTNATAAVSVNMSLDQLIMMTGSIFAIGATNFASNLLGEKNKEKASHVVSASFCMAFLFGTVLMILGLIFMEPLVKLLGATSTCLQYSKDYAKYVLLVAPLVSASFVMNHCLRGEGNALYSMFGMGFGGILNCFLDPLFILKLGLGVKGASIATAISKIVSFLILLYPYIRKTTLLNLSIKKFIPTKDIFISVVTIGSNSMLRTLLQILAAILLNNIAGSISDSLLAAVGVTNKVMMFPFGVVLGLGMGYQPVAGYNWGARDFKRVKEAYRYASIMAIIVSAIMGLVFFIWARQLICIFTTGDEMMMHYGALSIKLQSISLPIHAWGCIVNMQCNALRMPKGALAIASARQGTCFIPLIFPFAKYFGAVGVSSVQAAADLLSLVIILPVLKQVLKKIELTSEKINY